MWSQNSIDWKRRLIQAGVVAAAYYLTGRLAVSLAIPPGVATVVWPPSGVALAAVLLWGYQVWPGVWLGSVLVNIATLYDATSFATVARASLVVGSIGIGSTLQPLLGAFLIRRFVGATSLLDGPRDAFTFVGIGALSCVVASTIGATSLCLGRFAPWWAYRHTWFTWWMGDLVSVIVITPLALAWRTWTLKGLRPQHAIEAVALAVLLVGVGRLALWGRLSSENGIYSMKFVLIPFVVWAAFRFGQKAVTLVILGASGMAIWGAIHVARQLTWLNSQDSLLITQVFVGVMGVTGLALTSTLEERRSAVQALRNAHDELDLRVQKRTAELTDANELLRTAIVERQHREEALEESEARFRAVIESANDAVVQADGQGNIINWNPAAQVMFGYESEEVIGGPLTQLMATRYREQHEQGLVRFRTTGEPYLIGKTTELEGLRRNGIEFAIDISISHWTQGDEHFFGAIIRDITRRRKAEEALRDSEEMLRGLFEFAPDTVLVVDNRGCIVRVNRQAEAAFGYRREELLGQQVEMLLPERFRGEHIHQRDDYIGAPRLRPMGAGLELSGRRKDGSEFPVDIMLSPLALDHGHMVIAVVRDISRRKHALDELARSENQLRALAGRLQSVREEERTRTARELHDELGHALTGLKMDVAAAQKQLAKSDEDPRPVFRERLGAMSRLIDGMIKSVRRISSDLRPGLLDDVGLVASIEWQANDFQNRSGIACELRSLPDEISLSRDATTALFRIFQETLTNVARHAEADRVAVTMMEQDGYLTLEVSDNGRGISNAELADKASLGLLGMRERAAVVGGEVRITGASGKGTTVQVKIPVKEAGTRANPDR